jgi:hypothetical protein
MLHVNLAEVRDKKRAFRVWLVSGRKAGSIHDAIPKMDLEMAAEQRWQGRKADFVLPTIS